MPTPHGRSPECFFTSYDPQREVFCLIMEDMNSAGYTGGDQLSGGPGEGEPPHLEMFLKTQETIAKFNARCQLRAALPFYAGRHSLEIYLVILLPLLSFSVKKPVSPRAKRAAAMEPAQPARLDEAAQPRHPRLLVRALGLVVGRQLDGADPAAPGVLRQDLPRGAGASHCWQS